MRAKILGSAAGGGFPQWNCACHNCRRLRDGSLHGRVRTQTQVALSSDVGVWHLLNASPDLRTQLLSAPELAPAQGMRSTPIASIILTSADVDSVMGLLHLREFQPLHIYSTLAVRRILTEENSLFRTLSRSNPPVRWDTLPLDRLIPIFQYVPPDSKTTLFCKAISLRGSYPDYASAALRNSLPEDEAVIGIQLVQDRKRLFYAPTLPRVGEDWKRCFSESQVALLDGTFWADDELVKVQAGGKTARQMGHLPLSGPGGLLEQSPKRVPTRKILVHINNTNPILDEDSAQHRAVLDAGWEIAYDGMDIEL